MSTVETYQWLEMGKVEKSKNNKLKFPIKIQKITICLLLHKPRRHNNLIHNHCLNDCNFHTTMASNIISSNFLMENTIASLS